MLAGVSSTPVLGPVIVLFARTTWGTPVWRSAVSV